MELLPFEKIAEVLEKQFTRIMGEETYKVKRAELKAMENLAGKKEYEMVPVWVVDMEINDNGDIRNFQNFLMLRQRRSIFSNEEIFKCRF